MHDTGDRGRCAALDVRHRTGDRTRCRDTAEERHDEVGDTLTHQFLVRVVAVIGHGVGHASAKKRFDSAQQSERDHRADEVAKVSQVEVGHLQRREVLRDTTELATDRFDREVQSRHGDRGDDEHDDRARDLGDPTLPSGRAEARVLRPELHDHERDECHTQGIPIHGMDVGGIGAHLTEEVGGDLIDVQTQEVLDLRKGDQNGNTVGEADHDRDRDESDEIADFQKPH